MAAKKEAIFPPRIEFVFDSKVGAVFARDESAWKQWEFLVEVRTARNFAEPSLFWSNESINWSRNQANDPCQLGFIGETNEGCSYQEASWQTASLGISQRLLEEVLRLATRRTLVEVYGYVCGFEEILIKWNVYPKWMLYSSCGSTHAKEEHVSNGSLDRISDQVRYLSRSCAWARGLSLLLHFYKCSQVQIVILNHKLLQGRRMNTDIAHNIRFGIRMYHRMTDKAIERCPKH